MRSLELNLASRPFHNDAPIWLAHGLLAVALLAFTVWNVRTYLEAVRQLEALQADLGSVEKQLANLDRREEDASRGIRVFDLKTLTVQSEKANDIILRRGLSWTQLFNTLERVVPYEVKMATIRPVYGTREAAASGPRGAVFEGTVPVDAEGTAQSLEAFLELERALIMDPHFANVEPIRTESSEGVAEVRFQLRFLYDPAGRLNDQRPDIPHVLDAARKAAEEGGEAPSSALEEAP